MPIHDWTRVPAGTFHAFHTFWISELAKALNDHLLPEGYYALPEQVISSVAPDVVTLHVNGASSPVSQAGLSTLLPSVRQRTRPTAPARGKPRPRQITIRTTTGHRAVAIIEVVSPSNKDRRTHVRDLARKIEGLLRQGIHVLLLDLLPSGRHDPGGMHAAVWARFDRRRYVQPDQEPLTLASYRWDSQDNEPEAFIEPTAVGRSLLAMPLFLTSQFYVPTPLEESYTAAFAAMPQVWRDVLNPPAGQ